MTRRLALLLAAVLLPALFGSLSIHTLAAREAWQAQLSERNQDAAATLALVLAPLAADRARLETAAAAQFGLGFYLQLEIAGPAGDVWFRRSTAPKASEVPAWFAAWVPLAAASGRAPLVDGGRTIGHVEARTHFDWAERALWQAAVRTAWLLGLLAVGAGLMSAALLRGWRAPLADTVAQAQALAQARFVEAPEPEWPELRDLTRAMNAMVRRLREQFDAQAEHVAALQRQAQSDAVSGLPLRSQLLGRLADLLADRDAPASALLIVRVNDLDQLNERHGRDATDRVLVALADVLMTYVERVPGAAAGRLNGTDFALVLPAAGIARETAESVCAALAADPTARLTGTEFVVGGCDGLRGMSAGAALAAADAALAQAEASGELVVEDLPDISVGGERAWRELLSSALDESRVQLGAFPVVDAAGALIHLECPLRVQVQPGGEFLVARRWLALAARSRLMPQVDQSAVHLALEAIARDGRPRCVHVSPRSFRSPAFAGSLLARLAAVPEAARRLSIEWTDAGDAIEVQALREAVAEWQRLGVRVGVEHAGASPKALPALKDAGISYVKVDSRHVRGVADDAALRSYAESLVKLIHGLGLTALAEGVDDLRDLSALWTLGFDGATGHAVGGSTP